jgi:hypothetical protein
MHADARAASGDLLEHDVTFRRGENRVIAAKADVHARVKLGAALPDDDVAGNDMLAAKPLYAQALALTVTTVAGRPATFFVRHFVLL